MFFPEGWKPKVPGNKHVPMCCIIPWQKGVGESKNNEGNGFSIAFPMSLFFMNINPCL